MGKGRPKIPAEYKAALVKLEPLALQALGDIIADPKHPHRVVASKYVLDRVHGKPTERSEISAPGGGPLIPPTASAALEALRKLVGAPPPPPPPPGEPPPVDPPAEAQPAVAPGEPPAEGG